jgi:hypothetical protein
LERLGHGLVFQVLGGRDRKQQDTDMSTHPFRLMSAAAALCLFAAPVLAAPPSDPGQSASSAAAASQPTTSTPPATSGAAAATGSNANATTSATAPVTAGLTVKDNTGVSIGQVAAIDTDSATGQKMATIKMGADTFRLPADKLAVADGAATVNLTQAQIQAQLHPKK